ncbi:MAG TPA: phytanoyl-CoA dioxygenase family protein [Actinocrinis sp.]|uniref:phytanoyl-CoA dioxygenase family protein n=1 Tax=Actinocrinis sp. TaxID=1920516 RepID=UPI002D741E4F|nr:phytanoyl-CoA dioxygenase family protein [Actinocrinis sp.]HZU58205.1 phytanoyl-CoA dioxygenase family protein [Actinocrinis sp.]
MAEALLEPTEDVELARHDLAVHGYCVVSGALDETTVKSMRDRLVEQSLGESVNGVRADQDPESSSYVGGAGLRARDNRRVWNLVNKGTVFEALLRRSTVLELVGSVLGNPFLLSGIQANFVAPGDDPLPLHSDQGYVARPWPPYAMTASVIWMLHSFTEENGATTVVPGSHIEASAVSPDEMLARARLLRRGGIPVCAPAGSALVFDGRIVHGTGRNSTEADRLGVLTYFCRPFLRQQENFSLSVAPRVLAGLSDEVKQLLGFSVWKALGSVEGVGAEGSIVDRPARPVEALDRHGRPCRDAAFATAD